MRRQQAVYRARAARQEQRCSGSGAGTQPLYPLPPHPPLQGACQAARQTQPDPEVSCCFCCRCRRHSVSTSASCIRPWAWLSNVLLTRMASPTPNCCRLLGLTEVADTIVGDAMTRGISG